MGRKKKDAFRVVENATAEDLDMAEVEKEFVDILNYRRKQKNNLLGNFSSGEYKIPEEIVKELVAVPKIFDHFDNNFLYASIKLASVVLNFRVEMDIQPDFCRAKLYIIEIEQGIEEDTKHITLLDEILQVYSPTFRENFEKKWNIVYGTDAVDKTDFLERYLSMQSEEFRFNKELEEILSQLYVLRMLQHLAAMGELGDKISFEYKLLMEKHLNHNPGFALDFTLQKELLDYVISKFNGFEKILQTQEGMKIMKGYSSPLKNVRDKTYPSILTEVKKTAKAEKTVVKTKAKAKKQPVLKKKSSSSKPPKGTYYDVAKNYKPTFTSSKKKSPDKKKKGPPATGATSVPKNNNAQKNPQKEEEKEQDNIQMQKLAGELFGSERNEENSNSGSSVDNQFEKEENSNSVPTGSNQFGSEANPIELFNINKGKSREMFDEA